MKLARYLLGFSAAAIHFPVLLFFFTDSNFLEPLGTTSKTLLYYQAGVIGLTSVLVMLIIPVKSYDWGVDDAFFGAFAYTFPVWALLSFQLTNEVELIISSLIVSFIMGFLGIFKYKRSAT